MSANHDRPPPLSTAAESDMVGYSAISQAAVAALLLGLASFFAIGNLLWLILPALAIFAAAVALVSIARSDGSVSGRWVALTGLALALLFASTAISRSVSRAWHLRSEARTIADNWLDLVRQGKLQSAHQWHLPAPQRQRASTSLAQFYEQNGAAREQLEGFFLAAPLNQIVAAPPAAALRYERVAEQLSLGASDRVALAYVLESLSQDGTESLEFVVVVERTKDKGDPAGQWQIAAVAEPQDKALTP